MFWLIFWITLLAIVHISFGVCSYLILRKLERCSKFPNWTRGERRFAIMISCGGIFALIFVIPLYIADGPGSDEKVNW